LTFSTNYVRNSYDTHYNKAYQQKMAQKVGILISEPM
jgi:hypothetical protein